MGLPWAIPKEVVEVSTPVFVVEDITKDWVFVTDEAAEVSTPVAKAGAQVVESTIPLATTVLAEPSKSILGLLI